MLIDFSKKKKLVAYKEKAKPKKTEQNKNKSKPVHLSEMDTLLIKSAGLLDENASLFSDIPLENAEIAVVLDPCSKSHKNAVSLYDQYTS
ncbi:hypothetical protein NEMIN01_2139 [Nematocida minor]|uniref:uncharacterized protein n=1 Tax=Nematocida minor TaxID=1912983 RepID=UPI00221FDB9F|nr:uncharacterized protein NEMIN01_2139 [Nematocida minor]KAI5192672.1 hypothetical protein NEMIN01_2139 [Nematocida minor]